MAGAASFFHDVINQKFAHKAIEKGADGLILVIRRRGWPRRRDIAIRFVAETRQWFDGPIALSGRDRQQAVRSARCGWLGADFAYIGSAFIATNRSQCGRGLQADDHRIDRGGYRLFKSFTGVHGNYLKPSIVAAGMDPDNLPESDASKMSFGTDASANAPSRRPGRKSGAAARVLAASGKIPARR